MTGTTFSCLIMENMYQKYWTCFQLECIFCYFKSMVCVIWLFWKKKHAVSYLEHEKVKCISYLKLKRARANFKSRKYVCSSRDAKEARRCNFSASHRERSTSLFHTRVMEFRLTPGSRSCVVSDCHPARRVVEFRLWPGSRSNDF